MRAVRITVICDELVRIEESPAGRFCDWPSLFAVHGPGGAGEHPGRSVHTLGAGAIGRSIDVKTSRLRLRYVPDGRPLGASNLSAWIRHASAPAGVEAVDGWVRWAPGMRATFNLGGTAETLDGARGRVDLGQGLLARDGWHVVDDSEMHLLVDGWAAPRAAHGLAGNTDWYLFAYGEDYSAAFAALAMIGGRVPLPRRSALGSWYSRYWPYSSAEYRGIVGEFHQHGFPLDVLVLDMDWHKEGWTGWSWNRELIPDAEDLLAWMHEQGLAVTLNLHPADGVGPHEDQYGRFMEAIGRNPGERFAVPFDAADPVYMRALFEQVHRPLETPAGRGERAGVDFWWLDWQQQRETRSMPGLTNLRWLNHLYFQHTGGAAAPAGSRSPESARRGLSFSRWAGWGDHRHPVHFSGDAHTGWAMLAFQVEFTSTAGNVGCFYWSHDIGGHFGPRFEEATTRWVQFGALSPVLRLHSARSPVLDRRPWTYEARFTTAMRGAYELRCRLMPYLYTQARRSFDRTRPLAAPMYVEWATHERAYDAPQQYLLGDALLCAPVTSPGLGERCVATQRVWFGPDGASEPGGAWYDMISGERHAAGSEVIVASAIGHVPLFVRAGVPVPMQPVRFRMTAPMEELVVRIFPGEPGQTARGELYEDDGESLGYLGDAWARTPIVAEWIGDDRLRLTIGPSVGRFAGQAERRRMSLELGGVVGASGATCAGKAVPIDRCAHELGGCVRVELGTRSVREAVRLELAYERADQAALAEALRREAMRDALGSDATGAALAAGALPHALASAVLQVEARSELRPRLMAIGGGIGACSVAGGTARRAGPTAVRVVDSLALIDDARMRVRIIDRVSDVESVVLERELTLGRGKPERGTRAAGLDLPPLALRLPPIGRRATRLARCECVLAGSRVEFDEVIESKLSPIEAFVAAGPYPWDWRWSIAERIEAPERAAPDQQGVSWTPARSGDKWATDFRATFPDRAGLGYAWTTLMSSRRQVVRLHVDASDKVEVFVNTVKVFSINGFDSHEAALGYVDTEFGAGANEVVVKASEGGGGWGFALCAECEHGLTAAVPGSAPAIGPA